MWLKFCWFAREWSFTKDQRREKNVSTETALFHSLGRIYWLIFSRFRTGDKRLLMLSNNDSYFLFRGWKPTVRPFKNSLNRTYAVTALFASRYLA